MVYTLIRYGIEVWYLCQRNFSGWRRPLHPHKEFLTDIEFLTLDPPMGNASYYCTDDSIIPSSRNVCTVVSSEILPYIFC